LIGPLIIAFSPPDFFFLSCPSVHLLSYQHNRLFFLMPVLGLWPPPSLYLFCSLPCTRYPNLFRATPTDPHGTVSKTPFDYTFILIPCSLLYLQQTRVALFYPLFFHLIFFLWFCRSIFCMWCCGLRLSAPTYRLALRATRSIFSQDFAHF